MRALSFTGFLSRYVQELLNVPSSNLRKLVAATLDGSSRAIEPLVLYAIFSDRRKLFKKIVQDVPAFQEALSLMERFTDDELAKALESKCCELPTNYLKCYEAYCSVRDKKRTENYIKTLMHKKIVKLQTVRGVSNYHLYSRLELNPGNANAFLTHGDPTKLSLENARRIRDYLEAA